MLPDQINLDREQSGTLGRQLFLEIRRLIEAGRLAAGTVLPASRKLASDLAVGRNTVLFAYEQLVLEGYLESDGRRGTWVSEASRGFASSSGGKPNREDRPLLQPHISRAGRQWMAVRRRQDISRKSFQPGLSDVNGFPHDHWARLLRRAARQVAVHPECAGYNSYSGLPALKQAILRHVREARGVVAEAEQVMVFSSAQAAMDLMVRLLLDADDIALHEEPGYMGMLAALRAVRADTQPINVEVCDAYQSLDRFETLQAVPRLIYTTPSHQYPTGQIMSLENRLSLISFATRHNCFILEDDYDSEFHFAGAPISSLQGLDRQGSVIYMGTFSKSLMPAMHVAYLVVPKSLIEPVAHGMRNTGAVPSLATQWALADFIDEGFLRGHIARMSLQYKERRDLLCGALERYCCRWLTVSPPDGGIQLAAYFAKNGPAGALNDKLVARAFAANGVESTPLSSLYWSNSTKPRHGLLLGYAASDGAAIEAGARCLSNLLDAMTS